MSDELQRCTRCGFSFPETEFIKKRPTCKKCTAKERSRACMNAKYQRDKLRATVEHQIAVKQAKERKKWLADYTKLCTRAYKWQIRSDRQALQRLSKLPSTPDRVELIARHTDALERFKQAYEKQMALLHAGVVPGAIGEYL